MCVQQYETLAFGLWFPHVDAVVCQQGMALDDVQASKTESWGCQGGGQRGMPGQGEAGMKAMTIVSRAYVLQDVSLYAIAKLKIQQHKTPHCALHRLTLYVMKVHEWHVQASQQQ